MEDEGSLGLVLARATELRLKIGNCVHRATTPRKLQRENGVEEEDVDEEEEVEEAQRLVSICEALESLESQLSSLQGLQQQQRYEREVALGEIEQSRKTLLDKLKEYKGEALDVINEASAFAGETVESNNDLLLPPYPTRPPHSLCRDNGNFTPHLPSVHKVVRNVVNTGDQANGVKKTTTSSNDLEKNKISRGLGFFLGAAAKTVFTIVGVVSVLSLSGFGPKFFKGESPLKVLGLFQVQQPASEDEGLTIKCPPGKVLVLDNGEARCLVKERVEVPFTSASVKPDVNYGCG